MSILTILIITVAVLLLIWAVWFVIAMIHYIASGQYEVDKRLRDVCR